MSRFCNASNKLHIADHEFQAKLPLISLPGARFHEFNEFGLGVLI